MKRLFVALIGALCLLGGAAVAQDDSKWPQRTVRLVVNVSPGGGIDTATRMIAAKLTEKFGQTFVVENKPGASGNLAADQVFHATPDGYTFLSCFGETLALGDLLFKNLTYDPTELEPVSLLTSVPLALIVRPDFPVKDATEFVTYAKANPGKLNFASNGIGTASHLTGELFMSEAGVKMTHVPYKGTAPVLNDLIASHIDLTFIQYSAFYAMHRAGKVHILAVAADKRVEALPSVPTTAEIGYPKIISHTWNMIAAPPKTPRPILEKMNRAINETLQMPDIRAKFAAINTTVEGGDLARARNYAAEDRARWKKVIAAAGIQPQ